MINFTLQCHRALSNGGWGILSYIFLWIWIIIIYSENTTAVESKKAVSAYFIGKQILCRTVRFNWQYFLSGKDYIWSNFSITHCWSSKFDHPIECEVVKIQLKLIFHEFLYFINLVHGITMLYTIVNLSKYFSFAVLFWKIHKYSSIPNHI